MVQRSPVALLVLLLASCAGTSGSVNRVSDPDLDKRAEQQRAAASKREQPAQVLMSLDQAIDSYVRALSNKGVARADRHTDTIERMVRQQVLDHFDMLVATATNSAVPGNQSIALAAIGFSGKREAMPVMLQGAQLTDELLVNSSVLGLAILQDPTTPPGILAAVMEEPKLREEIRIQAAWAIFRIQEVREQHDDFVAIWTRVLERPTGEVHPGILASAVRGMGLTRNPTNAALVARFVTHPTPRVRWIAAIALGRMNAQNEVEALFALLGPAETNGNVRLAARRALEALAGGTDRGYDVEEWRKVFQRG